MCKQVCPPQKTHNKHKVCNLHRQMAKWERKMCTSKAKRWEVKPLKAARIPTEVKLGGRLKFVWSFVESALLLLRIDESLEFGWSLSEGLLYFDSLKDEVRWGEKGFVMGFADGDRLLWLLKLVSWVENDDAKAYENRTEDPCHFLPLPPCFAQL